MASNRVLVVEDDPSVRGPIQAILEGESLEVVLAADGSLPFAVLVVTGAAEIADPLRRELGPDAVLESPSTWSPWPTVCAPSPSAARPRRSTGPTSPSVSPVPTLRSVHEQ